MARSRLRVAALAVLGALVAVAPAHAADLSEYGSQVSDHSLTALNGLVTAPADPVMATVRPHEGFRNLPGGVVLQYPLGLAQGLLLGAYRIGTGAVDLALCWVPGISQLSPQPRYDLMGVEEED